MSEIAEVDPRRSALQRGGSVAAPLAIAARFAQIADHQPAQDARELIIRDDGKAAIILDLVKRVAIAFIIVPFRRYLQELVADLGIEGGDSALLR